jgi:hypothetical protein
LAFVIPKTVAYHKELRQKRSANDLNERRPNLVCSGSFCHEYCQNVALLHMNTEICYSDKA